MISVSLKMLPTNYSLFAKPDRIISKNQKTVLDASLHNTQHYEVWIKSKLSNPDKGVATFLTTRGSNYSKGSLRVTLVHGRPTYYT